MQSKLPERDAKFFIEDDCLIREVTASDGRGYRHRCDLATFETVAYAVEETPEEGEGTTLTMLVKTEKLPFTRVNVALEFLKERGIVEVRHRRCYPASKSVHLDAMTEYFALAEEPKS
jgi:hypothetical protein